MNFFFFFTYFGKTIMEHLVCMEFHIYILLVRFAWLNRIMFKRIEYAKISYNYLCVRQNSVCMFMLLVYNIQKNQVNNLKAGSNFLIPSICHSLFQPGKRESIMMAIYSVITLRINSSSQSPFTDRVLCSQFSTWKNRPEPSLSHIKEDQ